MHETWRSLVGVWVEETDVQPPDVVNHVAFHDGGQAASATELFDILRTDTAQPIAEFQDDFYAGRPAVTVNQVGDGSAVYLASPAVGLLEAITDRFIARDHAWKAPAFVESVPWAGGGDLVFLLNHGEAEARIEMPDGEWTDVLTGRGLESEMSLRPAEAVVVRRVP
jgi:beta-galactosidase